PISRGVELRVGELEARVPRGFRSLEIQGVDPCARHVVRQQPGRFSAVRSELEDPLTLEQLRDRREDQRTVLGDRAIDGDRVDASQSRELDVAHARRTEALEVDPDVLEKSTSYPRWLCQRVADDASHDPREDLAVAHMLEARRAGRRDAQRDHAAPSARSTAGTVRTRI